MVLAAFPAPALGWGRQGHRIVADIAQNDLTPVARSQVMALLKSEKFTRLAQIANWADEAKALGLAGSPSHSIRFPLEGGPLLPDACPSGFCAVAAMEMYSKILADPRAPIARRVEALKYVVHLAGDIHQPLHCVTATGSRLRLSFQGKETTLHKMWDRGILNAQGKSKRAIEAELMARKGDLLGRTPLDWALESRAIARDTIYKAVPVKSEAIVVLPDDYARNNWQVVAMRMAQAGHRLGDLLNHSLK